MKKFLIGLFAGLAIAIPTVFAYYGYFDVPEDAWYTPAVAQLTENYIVAGYPDGSFGPGRDINRAEVAAITAKVMDYMDHKYDQIVTDYYVSGRDEVTVFTNNNTKQDIDIGNPAFEELSARNEDVSGFFAPTAADNKKLVYISTQTPLTDEGNTTDNTVYALNLDTWELTQIFHRNTDGLVLRIFGRDGNSLVLYEHGSDDSLGDCFQFWMPGNKSRKYFALNITNPESGLQNYTPPAYKIREAEWKLQACMSKMGAN